MCRLSLAEGNSEGEGSLSERIENEGKSSGRDVRRC